MLLSELFAIKPIIANVTCRKGLLQYKPYTIEYKFPLHDCFCGIEIEVENIEDGFGVPVEVWASKQDNSLRNRGVEFISLPVAGNDLVQSLELFFRYLPPTAIFSQRTSIHVHVNALDLDVAAIKRFVLLYLLFEKMLYRFVGKDRDRNIFCVPIQDSYRVSKMLNDLETSLSIGGRVEHEQNRYAGLNLACLHTFGTFEFRQLGGTRDITKILSWINMLLSFKKWAIEYDSNTLINEVHDLNTTSDYHSFLYKIFGPVSNAFDLTHASKDIERGVYAVKYSQLEGRFMNELVVHRSNNSKGMQMLAGVEVCVE